MLNFFLIVVLSFFLILRVEKVYKIGLMVELIGSIKIVIYIFVLCFGLWKFLVKDKILRIIIGI